MKKIFNFLLVIISLLMSSFVAIANLKRQVAQPQDGGVSPHKPVSTPFSDFSKTYTGLIGGKYAVEMELTKTGRLLTGSYFYVSKGIPIKLSGTIDANGYINLEEF